jgi:VCBS repeat-containing protein
MATPKGGLTIAVKFTPQAQNDDLLLQEDQLTDGTQSLSSGSDPNENILANDGGGAAATIVGITSDSVSAVQGNLTHYVSLANGAAPLSTSLEVGLTAGSAIGSITGTVELNPTTHNINFVLDGTNPALLQHLSAGESIDFGSFTYIIRMSNGAFSVAQADIKVAGDNDAAVITAGTNTTGPNNGPFTAVAAVKEDASASPPGTEGTTETSTGTLKFTDADWHDTHTASVESSSNLGHLDATVTTDTYTLNGTTYGSGDASTGVINLSYSVADSAIDHLGQGEQKIETFTVDLVEHHPGGAPDTTDTTTVSYTINGVNEAAVITAGTDMSGPAADGTFTGAGVTENASGGDDVTGVENANGTLAFTDVDWHDTHTIDPVTGVVPADGDLGTLTASVATDTYILDGSGGLPTGQIGLSYSVDDSAINYLGQGETKTETFTVNLVEHHPGDGSITTDPITVSYTITGTNDVAVIAAGGNTGSVTEDHTGPFTLGEGTTEHATSTLAFTDADYTDTHYVVGDAGVFQSGTDEAHQLGTLAASVSNDSGNGGTGHIAWDYQVDDAAINYLGAGETATETFRISLGEHHPSDPANDTTGAYQDVTVTITGTDDKAVFATSYDAGTGNHTEATVTDPATSDTPPPATFYENGTLSFTDADIHDTHKVTVDSSVSHHGTLTFDPVVESNGSGSFAWHYSVTDGNIDGFTGDDTFDVVLNDYSVTDPNAIVSTTHETVTVHLNGAADVTSHALTGIVFDPTQTGNDLTAPNFGHFQAIDPDGDTSFTYSLLGSTGTLAANGVAVDANTGDLSFTTSGGFSGTATVGATDAGGDSAQQMFNIIVGSDNAADSPTAPSGNTILAGQGQGDNLTGSSGVDYILGGSGNDTIQGNGGADVLMGGGGNDTFVFAAASDSTHAASDTILDFTAGHDTIAFQNALGLTTVDTTFNTSLGAGHVEWTQTGTNVTIYANTGAGPETAASGGDVMEIHLTGVSGTFSSADFNLHL